MHIKQIFYILAYGLRFVCIVRNLFQADKDLKVMKLCYWELPCMQAKREMVRIGMEVHCNIFLM